jgi:hypothetical protein
MFDKNQFENILYSWINLNTSLLELKKYKLKNEILSNLIIEENNNNYYNGIWDINSAHIIKIDNNNEESLEDNNIDNIFLRYNLNSNIYVDNNNKHNNVINNLNEFEDINCENDFNTIVNNNNKVFGYLDILLNPTYNIPYPCLQLWYANGAILSNDDVINLIIKYSNNNNMRLIDNQIIQDEHIIFGIPCYTLHMCCYEEFLRIIKEENKDIHNDNDVLLLLFLNCISIFSPFIGLNISPSLFKCYESLIKKIM